MNINVLNRFKECTQSDINLIHSFICSKFVEKNKYIFREMQPCDALYVIKTGFVKIVKTYETKNAILNIEGPGMSIGEVALHSAKVFPANAMALTDCEILIIPIKKYFELVNQSDSFSKITMNVLSEKN